MIPLNELPTDVLELIRRYYLASCRADDKRNASAVLQACLRRHLTQRCDDPAHAGFVTYTPRKEEKKCPATPRHTRTRSASRAGRAGGSTSCAVSRAFASFFA